MSELDFGVAEVGPGDGGVGMGGQDLAIARCRLRVLAFFFEQDGGAERIANGGIAIARSNENGGVTSAAPRLFQSRQRDPATLTIAPLRPDEVALRVDSIRH